MAEEKILGLPQGSGRGTSSDVGISLLSGKIKRDNVRAKKAEKASKWTTGLSIAAKGAGWVYDNLMENFNNSNTALYGKMDGLITNAESILTQNNDIVNSGKSYQEYFQQKRYDEAIQRMNAELEAQNKVLPKDYKSSTIWNQAGDLAKQDVTEWKNVVSGAQTVSTLDIETVKKMVQDGADMPENIAEMLFQGVRNLGNKALGRETPDTILQKDKALTLETLEGPAFDSLRSFASSLKDWQDTPVNNQLVQTVLEQVDKSKFKIIDTQLSVTTPVQNAEGEYVSKVVVTTVDTQGEVSSNADKAPLVKIANAPYEEIIGANLMNAISKTFSPQGEVAFTENLKETQGDATRLTYKMIEEAWMKTSETQTNLAIDIEELNLQTVMGKVYADQVQLLNLPEIGQGTMTKDEIFTRLEQWWMINQSMEKYNIPGMEAINDNMKKEEFVKYMSENLFFKEE